MNIQYRLDRLMATLEAGEAAIITGEINRLYFTGFPSTAGTLVITREKSAFIIDFRYIEAAKAAVNVCEVTIQQKDIYMQIDALLQQQRIKTVYVETSYLPVGRFASYRNKLTPAFIDSDRIDKAILEQRSIKDEGELALHQYAQDITDEAFRHILGFISPGRTEQEIATELEFFCKKRGSCEPAFSYIVVSGVNSSRPHGVPSGKPVESGDFITMDFGCTYMGYRSDMTRTVAVGRISEEQRRVYDTVLTAQLAALDAIRPGCPCKDIDSVARKIIYKAGYEGCFEHGLGHSVGLEIHEEPRFSQVSEDSCRSGQIMTVEPGIYLEGRFGVRIEDMVFITPDGKQNLTKSPKELIIL